MIPKKIVVLGPPLSGKGTQGIKLAEKLNYKIFSPGDIFREEIKNKTNLGKKIIHIINNGYLVDDKIVNETMEKRIRNVNSYVLDGYPRTIAQADFLNELVSRTKEKIDLVIIINIDKKESIKRAKDRSRDDDKSIDILNTRWEEYQKVSRYRLGGDSTTKA